MEIFCNIKIAAAVYRTEADFLALYRSRFRTLIVVDFVV